MVAKEATVRRGSRAVKVIGYTVALFAVGIAGVFVGHLLRGGLPAARDREVTMRVPTSLLNVGRAFPDVPVLTWNGTAIQTGEMIGATGCVVLFLDLECPPCEEMVARWERALDDGIVSNGELWGVAYQPRHVVETYVAEHLIRFPVVVDSLQTFLRTYEVDRFPLEVVVGASGAIRSTSYDSARPIDVAELRRLMAE